MATATPQELLLDQTTVGSLIDDCYVFSQSIGSHNYDKYDLSIRLDLLEAYWEKFKNRNVILQRSKKELTGEPYFTNNGFTTGLNTYSLAKAIFSRVLHTLSASYVLP